MQNYFSENFWRKISVFLLKCFLLFFPFNLQSLIYKSDLLFGQFNFYNGVFLNFSEIVLWLVFLSVGFSFLFRKKPDHSVEIQTGLLENNEVRPEIGDKILVISMSWLLIVLISIFWSVNLSLAVGAAFKWLELVLLMALLLKGNLLNWGETVKVLTWSLFCQALIGILQMISQHSLGLSFFGESKLSGDTLNIAKIDYTGWKFIRPAGTFPHANIWGAMMLFAYVIRDAFITLNNQNSSKFNRLINYFFVLAAVLSFSRTVWLALLVYLFAKKFFNKNSAKTLSRKRSLKIILEALLALLLIMFCAPLLYQRVVDFFGSAWQERLLYLKQFIDMLLQNPWGTGIGNYLQKLTDLQGLQPWQIQPVHNFFALSIAELGLLSLPVYLSALLMCGFSKKNFWQVLVTLMGLILASFDHYLYSIWPGQILLVLGLLMIVNLAQNSPITLKKD